MPTINFARGSATVNWDGGNSVGADQTARLSNQAARNIIDAQQGPPAPPEVIADMVNLEKSLSTTQLIVRALEGSTRMAQDVSRGVVEDAEGSRSI